MYTAYANAQLNEVLKVVSETHHIYLVNVSVCSADWFNSLPEEYQQILVEEADKAGYGKRFPSRSRRMRIRLSRR